jgi:hypothetical protein
MECLWSYCSKFTTYKQSSGRYISYAFAPLLIHRIIQAENVFKQHKAEETIVHMRKQKKISDKVDPVARTAYKVEISDL